MARCWLPGLIITQDHEIVVRSICGTWRQEKISPPLGDITRTWRESVQSVAFSPDGTTLASGSHGDVNLWDVATGENIATLEGHTEWVYSVAFSTDGTTLASGSQDGTV